MVQITRPFLKQLWLTFGASLGFLIIGLVRGYSASGIPSIEEHDPEIIQSSEQKSWIGAIPPLGAFVGSLLSGPLMQKAGRRRTLLLTAPLWAAGWLILGFAKYFPLILLGRIISGLCVGFVLAPVQVYLGEMDLLSIGLQPSRRRTLRNKTLNSESVSPIGASTVQPEICGIESGQFFVTNDSTTASEGVVAEEKIRPETLSQKPETHTGKICGTERKVSECCDPEIRGRLGSLPTLSMSLGIVLSYIAGNWLYWRYLAFFSALFCVALFVVLLPLPESPVWLETTGADASAAVKWLHLSARATATVKDEDKKPEKLEEIPSVFTRKVFFSSSVMKPLVVGFSLLFFQQFSGIDAVIFFTVEIFKSSGSKLDAMTATIIVGVVQLVSNAVSTMLVDLAGRRPLLLISAAIMCASMTSMGSAFYFEFEQESWLGYLPIASLVVFMMGFSIGFGGLPFLLLGELFPAHYRSQLSAMASAVNLLSMFTIIKSYHALDVALTPAGTFWMYACFCAIAFFFVLFMVPETKGKSLAEIEQHFRGEKKSEAIPISTIS